MYDMIRDIGSSVDSLATGRIFPYVVPGTLVQDLFHQWQSIPRPSILELVSN